MSKKTKRRSADFSQRAYYDRDTEQRRALVTAPPVLRLADMTPEQVAEIERVYGAKVKVRRPRFTL